MMMPGSLRETQICTASSNLGGSSSAPPLMLIVALPSPAIPRAGPMRRRAERHPQRLARHDDRDAERRRRLLAAFATVADVNDLRRRLDGEAHRAALAAADR